MVFCCLKGIYSRYVDNSLLGYMSLCVSFFRAKGDVKWYHSCTPEKGIGSFLGEMP